ASCILADGSIGSGPCVPTDVAWLTYRYFGDASCATPVLYDIKPRPDCPDPTAALLSPHAGGPACGADPDVYVVGGELPAASIYDGPQSSTCMARQVPANDDHYFYTLGPIMPRDAFARLVTLPVGTGSLRENDVATEAGDRFMSAQPPFFDSQYQE